jgi:hypothetical protein
VGGRLKCSHAESWSSSALPEGSRSSSPFALSLSSPPRLSRSCSFFTAEATAAAGAPVGPRGFDPESGGLATSRLLVPSRSAAVPAKGRENHAMGSCATVTSVAVCNGGGGFRGSCPRFLRRSSSWRSCDIVLTRSCLSRTLAAIFARSCQTLGWAWYRQPHATVSDHMHTA